MGDRWESLARKTRVTAIASFSTYNTSSCIRVFELACTSESLWIQLVAIFTMSGWNLRESSTIKDTCLHTERFPSYHTCMQAHSTSESAKYHKLSSGQISTRKSTTGKIVPRSTITSMKYDKGSLDRQLDLQQLIMPRLSP